MYTLIVYGLWFVPVIGLLQTIASNKSGISLLIARLAQWFLGKKLEEIKYLKILLNLLILEYNIQLFL